MKDKIAQVRKNFKDASLFHKQLMHNSVNIIETSMEAHSYVKEFCESNAPHFIPKMDEISRDFAIFLSRTRKADSIFNELSKSMDVLSSCYSKKDAPDKFVKTLFKEWIANFDRYMEYRKDLEEWLNIVIAKWAEYENTVIKYCD